MSVDDAYSVKVEWSEDGAVARVIVDRRAKLNILHEPLMDEMITAIETVSGKTELRCVVLTGSGDGSFIGGADIKSMAVLDSIGARAFITKLHRVCAAIRDCPVPVIARVNGYCLGAGMEIAAACDMRAAISNAKFGMPEVRVGIPSVIEAALLPRLIGWGRTNELLMTGRLMDANEALGMGFVESVAEDMGGLDAVVDGWVEDIVNAGPLAIRSQKRLMRRWESLSPDDAIAAGIDAFAEAYATDEPEQYMRKFLDRKRD